MSFLFPSSTITLDADDYAREVIEAARKAGLRVELDVRNEKINYKVREHSLAKVPALLVVGKKEAAERLVSIRRLGSEGQQVPRQQLGLRPMTFLRSPCRRRPALRSATKSRCCQKLRR